MTNSYNWARRKLTFEQAQEMRSIYASSRISQEAIAKQFKISKTAANKILQNSSYKRPIPTERKASMKVGDILESHIRTPPRARAIVFAIPNKDTHIIVTDFGNISSLTEAEVLKTYWIASDWCSPDVWLQDKVNLIKELFRMFPELKEIIDF